MSTVDDLPLLKSSLAGLTAERSEAEAAILYATIRDLTSTLSTDEVVQRLLDRVLQHLHSEIASILLLDSDRMLRIAHARGLPAEVVRDTRVPLGEGISGHVAETGVGLLIEDVENHPLFRRRNHERYSTSSAISAPLCLDGATIGVINVNNRRDMHAFGMADLHLVEAIAGHAAIALSNARRFEETLRRAQHDSLTGLANHGHFRCHLEVELSRAKRYGRELGLVLLDVDRFKALNDEHGHVAGDRALMGLAHVLRTRSRIHDLPARQGGEEFAVVLPETAAAGTACFAEKIRASVEAARVGPENSLLTVSLGTASFPDDGEAAEELITVADRRLYAAKQAGRNRVRSED